MIDQRKLNPQVACQGKEQMRSDIARKVAKKMNSRDMRMSAYHCGACGHWHVGYHGLSQGKEKRLHARPVKGGK